MRRRTMLLSALGLGAAAGTTGLMRGKHSLPPRVPALEERFRSLQQRLFDSAGLRATARFVDLADPPLRAQVIEAGQGEPVLFVHGGNSVAAGWTPLLARLQDRFHLYAPDRPGCGLTSQFNYQGVNLRAHGAAFLRSVLDALGLPRASLVANSMGGFFALSFALAHPGRVQKLVLLGEAAGSAPRPSLFHRLIGTRGVNTLLYSTALAPHADPASVRRGLQRSGLLTRVDGLSDDLLSCLGAGGVLPGAVESWITMVERAFSPAGAGLFASDSQLTWTLRPELPRLAAPTLWIWGERDPFGSPALGQQMAALMPRARCEVLPRTGHLPWLEELDRCAALTAGFLAEGA